ncbi:MAG: saccharopine dehydrogenase C-terminal domain-containing protein, partial [Candidatus Bathyarchaeia archaeon]
MGRVLVLGAGYQGTSIVKSLSSLESVEHITVVDIDRRKLVNLVDVSKTFTVEADIRDTDRLCSLLRNHDLASGALPSELGYHAMEQAASVGVDMVDTSFMPQDPFVLDKLARKNGSCIIPDCGVAPGLSHILVGNYLRKLGEARKVHILVGGLPQTPRPPLGYTITWSVHDLIEEYTRPARIVRDRTIVTVDPLSEPAVIEVPVLGKL